MERKFKEQMVKRGSANARKRNAARHYNEPQRRFVQSAGADERAQPISREERRELEQAELIGRRHDAGEDLEMRRLYQRSKTRR